jgi:hypothetical protein
VLGGGLRALVTTTTQTRQADYTLTVESVDDVAGNTLSSATVAFPGFGEFDARLTAAPQQRHRQGQRARREHCPK